ncbi:MAG: hypothetical protein LBB47_06095 [Spirochaetaceae bacterium]|nr:hypothetical protein [Spirochaetaceae bacterium]
MSTGAGGAAVRMGWGCSIYPGTYRSTYRGITADRQHPSAYYLGFHDSFISE